MTNLETNTRARRVEPVQSTGYVLVNDKGEILKYTLSSSMMDAVNCYNSINYHCDIRQVKLTIEVVE